MFRVNPSRFRLFIQFSSRSFSDCLISLTNVVNIMYDPSSKHNIIEVISSEWMPNTNSIATALKYPYGYVFQSYGSLHSGKFENQFKNEK